MVFRSSWAAGGRVQVFPAHTPSQKPRGKSCRWPWPRISSHPPPEQMKRFYIVDKETACNSPYLTPSKGDSILWEHFYWQTAAFTITPHLRSLFVCPGTNNRLQWPQCHCHCPQRRPHPACFKERSRLCAGKGNKHIRTNQSAQPL